MASNENLNFFDQQKAIQTYKGFDETKSMLCSYWEAVDILSRDAEKTGRGMIRRMSKEPSSFW